MNKLKPLLQKWLDDQESRENAKSNSADAPVSVAAGPRFGDPPPANRKRKRRTTIENNIKALLEKAYQANSKPNSEELRQVAAEHNLEKETVRVWFCNRRQREKRTNGYHSINLQTHIISLTEVSPSSQGLIPVVQNGNTPQLDYETMTS